MVEKKTDMPGARNSPKQGGGKPVDGSPKPVAVDRPGFDIGGSTGETTAGTGVGLGPDASDDPNDRRLPGRRGKPV